MTDGHESISVGEVFDALSERERRTALRTLRRRSSGVGLDALAEAVTDAPADAREDEVRARLHHAHLPKLDEMGLVEYDTGERTARCDWDDGVGESLADARRILERLGRGSE